MRALKYLEENIIKHLRNYLNEIYSKIVCSIFVLKIVTFYYEISSNPIVPKLCLINNDFSLIIDSLEKNIY